MAMLGDICQGGIVRFQRIFPVLQHRIQTFTSIVTETDVEDTVQYPPIKPRWPPGSWGSMTEKQAWQWWERKVELETQSLSVQERLEIVSAKRQRCWKFPVIQHYPKALRYQQDVTKTGLLSGMPDYYETLEEEATICLPTVRTKVEEALLLENDFLNRSNIQFKFPSTRTLKNQYIQFQLIDCLFRSLAADYPHLQTCQFGENVKVKAFWDRHGFPVTATSFKYDADQDLQLSHKTRMDSCFHTEFSCTQLRSELPLKPFVDHYDPLCTETPYPHFKYWPKDLVQYREKVQATCLPGYFHGDPCEFGLIAFDCPNKLHRCATKYGKEVAAEMQTGMGLITLFAWTVAQAYYLGFNTYTGLTYPLSGQMIITDGQFYSFFAYQLNTLELWKDDDANPLKNLCWHQENMKLFEDIQDGQLVDFNENVLKQVIKFFINQP